VLCLLFNSKFLSSTHYKKSNLSFFSCFVEVSNDFAEIVFAIKRQGSIDTYLDVEVGGETFATPFIFGWSRGFELQTIA